MLSPARPTRRRSHTGGDVALPDRRGFGAILDEIHHRFGIALQLLDAGGHHVFFQSRLETGDWLWISDYAANITPLAQRLALEAHGVHVGWHIAIYPTDTRTATADPFVWLASVTHETATAGQLPDLVATTLRSLARHEQHHIDAAGRHQVSVGIDHWN
ncbi:hypothetical protein A5722_31270 [Mycobacterium vulneris]|uniref:Uncharacterized protein n=1 Tax=Mycolicibacterium septicum DSM 44393 TaxID=1341646 RepID=A0A7X6MWT3_9MYCO|nr:MULTISPECIES: hypothetical protein [Mycolicibacterium]MBX8687873.1 hypothetical protein [Mycobacterium sp. 20091114027_K0903767]MCP3811022.1 hypothetical protein [Mycobacteriaceae bacterium Msp059]OCB48688.1 hypothetical protein A5721_04905 [Mycolicibacterium vulneris]NKZ15703.1 hypothetical protein [Mycolicibacterium septicum DSM 44393]OBK01657.1 hypothetical protein A5637_18835 [Mycolicibacterium fortuitum]